ncbi:MAG: elongation factor G, partial [Actinomycetota bacterium]
MQTYPSEKIRNALLFGHQGTGKTSLAEALLFTSGASTRLGKIEDGNTICDFEPEEMKRSLSVSLALAPIEWKEHKINLLDAPGYADFVFEVEAALRVADLGILVVSAVEGVEVQHQIVWELAAKRSLPRMVFVNKLERERASYSRTLEDLTARLGGGFAPLHLPIGEEHEFGGIADILTERAYSYDASGKPSEAELPGGVAEQAEPLRTQIIESVAESDDALLEKYLEGETLESKEIVTGLAKGLATGNVFPVLAGSATKLVGIDRLADFLVEAAPSPTDRGPAIGKKPGSEEEIERPPSVEEPASAFVFKTVSDPYVGRISLFKVVSGKVRADSNLLNVSRGSEERLHQLFTLRGKNQENVPEVPAGDLGAVAKLTATASGDTLAEKSAPVLYPPLDPPERALARAIAPKTKGDEDKLMTGLARIQEEDPALQLERNTETHQTVLWGTGEAHLDVVLERLARKFGVGVQEIPLRIAYRETVKGNAQGIGRHVKQSGGHGQYG